MVLYKECTDESRIESAREEDGREVRSEVSRRIDAGGSRPNPFLNWWWATHSHTYTCMSITRRILQMGKDL
jgi:hypothetical protein